MKNVVKIYKAGARILTEGEAATLAYMIEKGEVSVSLEKDGKVVQLAVLGPGSIFGESALVGDLLYGAHVDALTDVQLALITPDSFQQKLQDSDPMLRALIEMLIHRQHKTNQALLKSETRTFIDVAFI